jgi:HEAT repeat protein
MVKIGAYKPIILILAVIVSVLLELIVHYYFGVTIVYTHFFYIVIVVAGLWYHRKAVYIAIILGSIHVFIEYLQGADLIGVLIRAGMFILVAFITGYLAETMEKENNALANYLAERSLYFRQSQAIRSGEAVDVRNQPEEFTKIRRMRQQQDFGGLVKSLTNNNPDIRNKAAEGLGELRDARAVEPLSHALKDPDQGVRWKAAEALGKIGAPAVGPLIAALNDRDSDVRWKAAIALGETKDPQAVDPLIHTLGDEDRYVRSRAAIALGEIGIPARDALIRVLESGDEPRRWGAAIALGRIGDRESIDALLSSLRRRDGEVQQGVIRALGEIGEPAVAPLIQMLQDVDACAREEAVRALGEIGEPAVETLIATLQGADDQTREEAIRALGEVGDKRAVEALVSALIEGDADIRKAASDALMKVKRSQ